MHVLMRFSYNSELTIFSPKAKFIGDESGRERKEMQAKEIRKNEGTFLPKVSKLGDSRRSEAPLYPVGRGVSGASLTKAIIRPNTAIQKSSHTDEGLGSGMQRCSCYHANSNGTGRDMYQLRELVIV